MSEREKVAKWLWDFLEGCWSEVDKRDPVSWDDFKGTDGFDADWWRTQADELLTLLEPSQEPVAKWLREALEQIDDEIASANDPVVSLRIIEDLATNALQPDGE